MNILILEDEIPAFEMLLKHLEEIFKNNLIYRWARTVAEAKILLLERNNYDIILSDIKLLDGTSFDIFNEIPISCPIIFCSAYDQYLFEAFKSNGIAYILKPYTQADLNAAFKKHKTLFKGDKNKILDQEFITEVKKILLQKRENYKERFIIKTTQGTRLLLASDVSYIEAAGTFCKLIDHKGNTHVFSQNIGTLIEALNPRKFFRINRSQIINLDHIDSMETYFKNRLLLLMKGAKQKIFTSSSTTPSFRLWLEGL